MKRFAARVADELVDLRVEHRLAASELEAERAELLQAVDAGAQHVEGHGRGYLVELIAVAAAEVAAPHDHELRQKRSVESAGKDAHQALFCSLKPARMKVSAP